MPTPEQIAAVVREWVLKAENDLRAAAAARYPGWPAIPLKEAREAVRIARRVRAEARRVLPRAAVRALKPKGKR